MGHSDPLYPEHRRLPSVDVVEYALGAMLLPIFLSLVVVALLHWISCLLQGQDLGEALYHACGLTTAIVFYVVVPMLLIYWAVRMVF